jgi:voltage-gated sodium channel
MIPKQLQSRLHDIRSSKSFELFVVAIIVFSALVIGVKTYPIPQTVAQVVTVLDWMITFIFLVEIVIRYLAETDKRRFFQSAWNIFDTTIVMVSLIPIDNSDLAVVGRLIRIFRVLRMVSIIPELRMLLNSLLKALPRLGYVALLMFIIFYIYAAIGSTFFGEINPTLWGDIARSMLTLFRVMTFEDWTDVMYETMEVHPFSWIYYLSFIFFTAFAFLNMIIGIVVNVLEEENREQDRLHGEPTLQELRQELLEIKALLKSEYNKNNSAQ